jgi:biopolymer transport protein ExbD
MSSETLSADADRAPDVDEGPVIPRRRIEASGDMDITPMIDITFLLLIFFIVSSTMSRSGDVELAKARHGRSVEVSSCFEISIKRDGRSGATIELAGQSEALSGNDEQQAEAIRTAVIAGLEGAKTEVLIKADKGVHWRHVERVRTALIDIEGLENVHLAVEEIR